MRSAPTSSNDTRACFSPLTQKSTAGTCAILDNGIGKVELAIKFEGARMHREGARGRPRFGSLIDDPNLDAKLCRPECEDQAGWPGANDQNVERVIGFARSIFPCRLNAAEPG